MSIVSCVNMKGGVAKTTLTVNLADCLARREDQRVLIIDLDPQFNATQCLLSGEDYIKLRNDGGQTIYSVFDDAPAPLINPVLGAREQKAVELADIKPWKIKENLHLMPGDLDLYRLEMGGAVGREHRLGRYLEEIDAKHEYDFVIIDTPPTPSHWMTSALLASEFYLVPVKPEPLSRVGIDLLQGVVNRCSQNYGSDIKCLGVVLTIAEEHTVVYREAVAFLDSNDAWSDKRFAKAMPKRTKIAREQGKQNLILDLDDQEAKLALSGITKEFLQRINDG